MEQIIEVKRAYGEPSKIYVGDLLDGVERILPTRRTIIITDSNVHRNYKQFIDRYEHIIIGMGETNKTLTTMEKIYAELIEMGVDRECFILGFGGGIVTDVAGFAASTYMRGLRFGFIASTLLAQVDASVGGKNGVNVDGYKNMAGTFNQPDFVVCDSGVLRSLPPREFTAGMAEIIKAGVIADKGLFELFEEHNIEKFKAGSALLTEAIRGAIGVKARIVELDERESGERRKLNLGHTFAHAIEKSTSNFLHGEAVAIGLVMVSDLAVTMGLLAPTQATRIRNVVSKAGLPMESGVDVKRLLKALQGDKKRDADSINLVLPTGIGTCEVRKITFEELEKFY